MITQKAANKISKRVRSIGDGLEIVFSNNRDSEIEVYWNHLRIPCATKTLDKALSIIESLQSMGAYFE